MTYNLNRSKRNRRFKLTEKEIVEVLYEIEKSCEEEARQGLRDRYERERNSVGTVADRQIRGLLEKSKVDLKKMYLEKYAESSSEEVEKRPEMKIDHFLKPQDEAEITDMIEWSDTELFG